MEKPAQPPAVTVPVQSRLRTGPGLPFFGPHSHTATWAKPTMVPKEERDPPEPCQGSA